MIEPVRAVVEPVETPFTILTVCTGNICRSPLAEQLLRHRLEAAGVPVTVLSAGTGAVVDAKMTPESIALAVRYDCVPGEHSAHQLTAELVANADLILAAAREHRSSVVSLYPKASRYAFTLNQFARLIDAPRSAASLGLQGVELAVVEPAEDESSRVGLIETMAHPYPTRTVQARLRAYVAEIAALRGFAPPPLHASDDDIVDPYRKSARIYDRSGRAIDAATALIVAGLAAALCEH